MNVRSRVAQFVLWLSVLRSAVLVGGTLYQTVVVVPMWAAHPPESVQLFFGGTGWADAMERFFTFPFPMFGLVLTLVPLWLAWPIPSVRRWLVVVAVIAVLGVALTLLYIYPINDVLFGASSARASGDMIRQLTPRWVVADRVRLGLGTVAFLLQVRALGGFVAIPRVEVTPLATQ